MTRAFGSSTQLFADHPIAPQRLSRPLPLHLTDHPEASTFGLVCAASPTPEQHQDSLGWPLSAILSILRIVRARERGRVCSPKP